jgi:EAL domain-containing protein (putative c-di-GMP-specific phosphodiesterase class I)
MSIGVIEINEEDDVNETLRKGSLCCHKAKELGRGRIFSEKNTNHSLESETAKIGYVSNISQAIENNCFFLAKQLIKPIDGTNEVYYEVLIRLKDDVGNLIPPSIFIPAAEKYGGIMLIDRWVLTNIIDNYASYFSDNKTKVSINLSTVSLSNELFLLELKKIIVFSKVNLSNICFEITETALVSNLDNALRFIFEMKQLGIQFALDDFGSGSSSFEYLKNLPVDYVKIDGSLIRNIKSEPIDYEIVKSINKIAKMMGMKTIAEYVENEEIELTLRNIGIDYIQGFYVEKPKKIKNLFMRDLKKNEKEIIT